MSEEEKKRQSSITEEVAFSEAKAVMEALHDKELMSYMLSSMDEEESVNKNPLTKIPTPKMRLYGFSRGFRSVFFDKEEELIEFAKTHNESLENTCVIEYLGNVAGRSDVIRQISKNGQTVLYTAIDEDGYGIYNAKRSIRDGEFTWEYYYGDIRELYTAFRNRGIVFENDIYGKIDEIYNSILLDDIENNKSIYTNDMIILCHIVNEFNEFEKRLLAAISSKHNKDFEFQVSSISKGKFKLGAKKAKKFYEENKSVIDIINQYSDLPTFIYQNYGWQGKRIGNLRFFYEYLVEHKEEIPKILELLEKLKELGFKELEFNEELDFTKEKYLVYPSLGDNIDLTYVANPQGIPNYASHINFATRDSNYKITLSLCDFPDKEESGYKRKIVLNSLLFNPNTLPEKISREYIHNQLVRLKKEQKDESDIIKTSVYLNISISDLERQFNDTYKTISELYGIENKEEFAAILRNIKENLGKLKTLNAEYDSRVAQESSQITPELLEQERNLYIRARKKRLGYDSIIT